MSSGPTAGRAAAGSVLVVVTNWNGRALLPACLDAVLRQRYPGPFRVVVVDNRSEDGSVAFVRQRYPDVAVLVNDANNYSRASNLGAAAADSEFIALLDNDAVPAPDWLAGLAACLRDDPDCGAASALVRFPDGRINSTGVEALPGFTWRERDFGGGGEAPPSGEVDAVSGCAALWRRKCWEEIGGLDEDFELIHEDVDASLRARARGWRLRFCACAEVVHAYRASVVRRGLAEADAAFPFADRLAERNRLLILARHYPSAFASELPVSRFFQEAGEAELARGLDLALARAHPGLPPAAHARMRDLLLGCRRVLAERESWARRSEVEADKRELQAFGLLARLDAASAAVEQERRRADALAREAAEHARRRHELQGEVERLMQELHALHAGYRAERERDAARIARLQARHQAELALRDGHLEELRRALGLHPRPQAG